jgi:hypothetical protein
MIEDHSSIMIAIDNLVTIMIGVEVHQEEVPSVVAMINEINVLLPSMIMIVVVIIPAHSLINIVIILVVHSMINVIVLLHFTINDHLIIILDHITIKIDPEDQAPSLIITEIFHLLRVMTMKTWEVTQLQLMKKMTGWITPMIQCQNNEKIQGKIHAKGTQGVVPEDPEMTQGVLVLLEMIPENQARKKSKKKKKNECWK